MVNQEFKIVVKKLDRLEKFLSTLEKITVQSKQIEKVSKALDGTSKKSKKVNDISKGMFKKTDGMSKFQNMMGDGANKLFGFGQRMQKMTGQSKGLGAAFQTFGGSMSKSMGAGAGPLKGLQTGLSSVFKLISKGGVTVTGVMGGLATVFATVLAPMVAMAAIAFVLKKAWQVNLGGIQNKFAEVMGTMKQIWAEFNVRFMKTLQRLSPLFDALLTPLFQQFKILLAVGKAIFDGLFIAIEPIIVVFEELGTVINELFGGQKADQAKILENILWGIGKAGKIVGMFFAGLLKATGLYHILKGFSLLLKLTKKLEPILKPIRDMMRNDIIKSWDLFMMRVKQLGNIFKPITDSVMGSLNKLWNYIVKIVSLIPDMFLTDGLMKIKHGEGGAPAAQASGPTNNQTTHNNQQVTINSNQEMTANNAGIIGDSFLKNMMVQ